MRKFLKSFLILVFAFVHTIPSGFVSASSQSTYQLAVKSISEGAPLAERVSLSIEKYEAIGKEKIKFVRFKPSLIAPFISFYKNPESFLLRVFVSLFLLFVLSCEPVEEDFPDGNLFEKYDVFSEAKNDMVEQYRLRYPQITSGLRYCDFPKVDSILHDMGVFWKTLSGISPVSIRIKSITPSVSGWLKRADITLFPDTIVLNSASAMAWDSLLVQGITFHEYFHSGKGNAVVEGDYRSALEESVATHLQALVMSYLYGDAIARKTFSVPYAIDNGYGTKGQLFLSVFGIENWFQLREENDPVVFFNKLSEILGAELAEQMLQYLFIPSSYDLDFSKLSAALVKDDNHRLQLLQLMAFLSRFDVREKIEEYWGRKADFIQRTHQQYFWGGLPYYDPIAIAEEGFRRFGYTEELLDGRVAFWFNDQGELLGKVESENNYFIKIYSARKGVSIYYSVYDELFIEYDFLYSNLGRAPLVFLLSSEKWQELQNFSEEEKIEHLKSLLESFLPHFPNLEENYSKWVSEFWVSAAIFADQKNKKEYFFEKAVSKFPGSAEGYKGLLLENFWGEEGRALLKKAHRLYPLDASFFRGLPDEIQEGVKMTFDLEKPEIFLPMVELLIEKGYFGYARKFLFYIEMAFKKENEKEEFRKRKDKAYEALRAETAPLYEMIEEGENLYFKGDLEKSEEVFRSVLDRTRDDLLPSQLSFNPHFFLWKIYSERRGKINKKKARYHLDKAIYSLDEDRVMFFGKDLEQGLLTSYYHLMKEKENYSKSFTWSLFEMILLPVLMGMICVTEYRRYTALDISAQTYSRDITKYWLRKKVIWKRKMLAYQFLAPAFLRFIETGNLLKGNRFFNTTKKIKEKNPNQTQIETVNSTMLISSFISYNQNTDILISLSA